MHPPQGYELSEAKAAILAALHIALVLVLVIDQISSADVYSSRGDSPDVEIYGAPPSMEGVYFGKNPPLWVSPGMEGGR